MDDQDPPTGSPSVLGPPRSVQPTPEEIMGAFRGVLQTHEMQVLATMGLLIGYICVLFAKIFEFTNIYTGVFGVSAITLMLMSLSADFKPLEIRTWTRSLTVIVVCLLITAPQLYFAWTVSVSEVQAAIEAKHSRELDVKSKQRVEPDITITNSK